MRKAAIVVLTGLAVLAPQVGQAGEKTGTWTRITVTHIANREALQTLDPITLNQMLKTEGTFPMTYCADEAAPPPTTFQMGASICTVKSTEMEGPGVFVSEFSCGGKVRGRGTTKITYTSLENYTGETTYSTSTEYARMKWKSTFTGRWTGPTCTAPAPAP